MIIVKIMGGLGNQMFQYAIGRYLSHLHNTELYLDINSYHLNPSRKYELDVFSISGSVAPKELLKRVPFTLKDQAPIKIIENLTRKPIFRYIKEKTIDFDKELLTLPDNIYLDGYWQSWMYFSDIEKIIRNEFIFKTKTDPLNLSCIEEIEDCESVSVHIRRGDYIMDPKIRESHGFLGIEYYLAAIEKITEKTDNPHFFIFSDDSEWASQHIKSNMPVTYIRHNYLRNYEDMRLMSLCKHHIIANSSFSWWGAWLAKNDEQIVLAPDKWFKRKKCDLDDRLPKEWTIFSG